MISPLYGQLSPLRVPTILPPDPDALAYIAAVETADGQALEDGVKSAYDKFFKGLKQDGIFSAIKASCILAGARTLSGALVPLVGSAPTNFNFVSADYNRVTGLKGNGSSKRLLTINNNTLSQNSCHLYCRVTDEDIRGVSSGLMGTTQAQTGSHMMRRSGPSDLQYSSMNSVGFGSLGSTASFKNGCGINRSTTTNVQRMQNSVLGNFTQTSQPPRSESIGVFSNINTHNSSRIFFYSVGDSVSLTNLDTIVFDLMASIDVALP